MGEAVRMPGAGVGEEVEVPVGQVKEVTPERTRILGPAPPMIGVVVLRASLCVVEHREKLDDIELRPCELGNPVAILEDASPMPNSMDSVRREREILDDSEDQIGRDNAWLCLCHVLTEPRSELQGPIPREP